MMELESALILAKGCDIFILDDIQITYNGERIDTIIGKFDVFEIIRVKKG